MKIYKISKDLYGKILINLNPVDRIFCICGECYEFEPKALAWLKGSEHPESDQILSAQMAGPTPKGLLFTNRIDMDRPYTPSLCWFQIANMVLRISHFKWLEKCFGRTHLENRRTSLTQALGLRDVRKRAWSFCFFGVDLWGGE